MLCRYAWNCVGLNDDDDALSPGGVSECLDNDEDDEDVHVCLLIGLRWVSLVLSRLVSLLLDASDEFASVKLDTLLVSFKKIKEYSKPLDS